MSTPQPETPGRSFRTKLVAGAGAVALLVIGAVVTPLGGKIADLIWPAAEADLPSTVTAGQACEEGGPAVSVNLSYGFTGSTWWATAQPLPAGVLDKLRETGEPSQVLSGYAPVQSQSNAGTLLKVAVTGCGPKPVVVTNMRPVISKRDKPFDGSIVWRPPQGNLTVTALGFDLDAAAPAALSYEPIQGTLGGEYFSANAVQVQPQETVPLSVMALTRKSYMEWSIGFETLIDGQAWNFTVALPGGKPIQTTALAATYQSAYQLNVLSGYFSADPAAVTSELQIPSAKQ